MTDELDAGGEPEPLPGLDPPAPTVDPAEASAAADPLPGAKKRGGWPKGKPRGRRPMTEAQKAAARANGIKGAAAQAAKRREQSGPTDAQLREAVAGMYAATGMGVAFIDQQLGQTVAQCSTAAADAWVHLGQQNPAVRRVLVSMTTAGAAGELIAAHMPLLALTMARVQARRQRAAPAPDAEPVAPDAVYGTNGADPRAWVGATPGL